MLQLDRVHALDDANLFLRYVAVFLCLLGQPLTELGMGDLNQRGGPLAQALAVQVGHAVFRHDIVYVASGSNNPGALIQMRDDARDGPATRREGSAMIGARGQAAP